MPSQSMTGGDRGRECVPPGESLAFMKRQCFASWFLEGANGKVNLKQPVSKEMKKKSQQLPHFFLWDAVWKNSLSLVSQNRETFSSL